MEVNINGVISKEHEIIGKLSEGAIGGTNNYEKLINKPLINGIEISGDKTAEDFLLQRIMRPITNEEIENMFKTKGDQ